ncbi:hypothetical protein CXG81DRAFT_18709 [Caulochytrium protostelioides]|uniref:Uncharacterized protein n=1 Tax=Caulochytrium protostelioides TaxID=1555241 RepID=A0A4P9X8A5_9FUNG|nr:hypothetical protein CXG81DRAFT_18709 [Caulochytrium protostelioides]|eukprot:RKP01485.1 hypothetical protein CXG81DRAFT_18709 [Caulochytrium protostelioides]
MAAGLVGDASGAACGPETGECATVGIAGGTSDCGDVDSDGRNGVGSPRKSVLGPSPGRPVGVVTAGMPRSAPPWRELRRERVWPLPPPLAPPLVEAAVVGGCSCSGDAYVSVPTAFLLARRRSGRMPERLSGGTGNTGDVPIVSRSVSAAVFMNAMASASGDGLTSAGASAATAAAWWLAALEPIAMAVAAIAVTLVTLAGRVGTVDAAATAVVVVVIVVVVIVAEAAACACI